MSRVHFYCVVAVVAAYLRIAQDSQKYFTIALTKHVITLGIPATGRDLLRQFFVIL